MLRDLPAINIKDINAHDVYGGVGTTGGRRRVDLASLYSLLVLNGFKKE